MEEKNVSFSKLLIDFITPILTGQENEQEFFDKAKLGQLAWNFYVSDKNSLPFDQIQKVIFKNLTKNDADIRETLNFLVLRKELEFSQHDQFILKIEIRTNSLGEKTLYAESIPPDKFKSD